MCNGPCCVPCPHILQLYDRGSVQTFSMIYQVLAFISFLCSIFLVSSYIVFPQKRAFPGSIIWYYMLGVFLLHLNQMSVVGSDGFRVSCVDSITEAHQQNSPGCAVQTFVQTFAATYLIYWINLFMLNVHLSIVWKKDWFSERMLLLNVIGLVYGLVPAIGVLVSGASSTIGFNCMVDPQHVIGWILIPMGVIAWPGVGVTIFTVFYLIRLFLSAPGALPAKPNSSGKNQSEPNGSTTQEASNTQSAATKGVPTRPTAQVGEIQRMESSIPQDQIKPKNTVVNSSAAEESVTKAAKNSKAHKERVLGVLKKTWRSIALSVAIVIVFGSFWTFNLQIALTFINVSPSTPWLANWYACALMGNSQAVCAKQVAANIPPFIGVALSNITCGIGLMVFLIFGTAMLEDWKKLIVDKFFN
ncbi:hypothetical protein HDU79_004694 [Rhizoclosmatium sp. JEL0117]|nr:hypothetical protein HDU79_004694 [Rhizoclosmatium sp. JEL0117]